MFFCFLLIIIVHFAILGNMVSLEKLEKKLTERNMSLEDFLCLFMQRCSALELVHKKNNVSMCTLEKICHSLNCQPHDVISFTMSHEEATRRAKYSISIVDFSKFWSLLSDKGLSIHDLILMLGHMYGNRCIPSEKTFLDVQQDKRKFEYVILCKIAKCLNVVPGELYEITGFRDWGLPMEVCLSKSVKTSTQIDNKTGISFEPLRQQLIKQGFTFSVLRRNGVIVWADVVRRLNNDLPVRMSVLELIAAYLNLEVKDIMKYDEHNVLTSAIKTRDVPDKIKAMKFVLSLPTGSYTEMAAKVKLSGFSVCRNTIHKWLLNQNECKNRISYYETGMALNPMTQTERTTSIAEDIKSGYRVEDVAWRYNVSAFTVSKIKRKL